MKVAICKWLQNPSPHSCMQTVILRNWFEAWRSKHLKWYYAPYAVPEASDTALDVVHQSVADTVFYILFLFALHAKESASPFLFLTTPRLHCCFQLCGCRFQSRDHLAGRQEILDRGRISGWDLTTEMSSLVGTAAGFGILGVPNFESPRYLNP